jgi:hypothetical protein
VNTGFRIKQVRGIFAVNAFRYPAFAEIKVQFFKGNRARRGLEKTAK